MEQNLIKSSLLQCISSNKWDHINYCWLLSAFFICVSPAHLIDYYYFFNISIQIMLKLKLSNVSKYQSFEQPKPNNFNIFDSFEAKRKNKTKFLQTMI